MATLSARGPARSLLGLASRSRRKRQYPIWSGPERLNSTPGSCNIMVSHNIAPGQALKGCLRTANSLNIKLPRRLIVQKSRIELLSRLSGTGRLRLNRGAGGWRRYCTGYGAEMRMRMTAGTVGAVGAVVEMETGR